VCVCVTAFFTQLPTVPINITAQIMVSLICLLPNFYVYGVVYRTQIKQQLQSWVY